MANNQKSVMKKVLRRIRPYWPALAGSLLLATLQVAMTLYIPILVGMPLTASLIQAVWILRPWAFIWEES